MFCNKCGAEIKHNSMFCPECGNKLENVDLGGKIDIKPQNNNKTKNVLLIVLAVVLAFIMGCALCIVLVTASSKKNSVKEDADIVSLEDIETDDEEEVKESDADENKDEEDNDAVSDETDNSENQNVDETSEVTVEEETASTNDETRRIILEHYKTFIEERMHYDDMGTYFESSECPLYVPEYALVDLNGDGYEDLIVSGALGLRSKELSEIYMYIEGKHYEMMIDGSPYSFSNGCILVSDEDYGMAGCERYSNDSVYRFDENGGYTKILERSTSMTVYDQENDIEYDPPRVDSDECYVDGIAVSAEQYDIKMAEYSNNAKVIDYVNLENEDIRDAIENRY